MMVKKGRSQLFFHNYKNNSIKRIFDQNPLKEKFFRKGNLIALRELALRFTADRVEAQVILHRQGEGIKRIWPLKEKILVWTLKSFHYSFFFFLLVVLPPPVGY